MRTLTEQITSKKSIRNFVQSLYRFLAAHAASAFLFTALLCTLIVKFFQSYRLRVFELYPTWILSDIAVLLTIEAAFAFACFCWPKKWVLRSTLLAADFVCTWSFFNAGWLIRTGNQLSPFVFLPLLRDPPNALQIVAVNIIHMPAAAALLLPGLIALTFFFLVLAKPIPPNPSRGRFILKFAISAALIFAAIVAQTPPAKKGSEKIIAEQLAYNSQLRAIKSLIIIDPAYLNMPDFENPSRRIPYSDQLKIFPISNSTLLNHNVIIVVLEGVQYRYTSLADDRENLTPYLAYLAAHGIEFTNTHCTLTHTTKALFSLFTGRFPSVSQDLAETVPVPKPYLGLPEILKQKMNFRTAFFQSAKGNFESRPALVHNLGFDTLWTREKLNDTSAFIGYLACDEFEMLQPITQWIKSGTKPFLLVIMCSVTHDPYKVPQWFAAPAKNQLQRYKQSIAYTDRFIAALDTKIAALNLTDKTIFAVISDHAEGFGEHGLFGHERIPFEEALRVPWLIRAPSLIPDNTKIHSPVATTDLTPTILSLLNFDVNSANFDGLNALAPIADDRKIFFASWMRQTPAGFITQNKKIIYDPLHRTVSAFDLTADPQELKSISLSKSFARQSAMEIINWQKNSVFSLEKPKSGQITLYDSWLCRWNNRISSTKSLPSP